MAARRKQDDWIKVPGDALKERSLAVGEAPEVQGYGMQVDYVSIPVTGNVFLKLAGEDALFKIGGAAAIYKQFFKY